VAAKVDDATVTQVMVIGQKSDGSLLEARSIFDTVAGTNPDSLRVAVGSAPSGLRAMVAVGFDNQDGADVKIFALGNGGQMVGPMENLPVATKWACPYWSTGGRSQAPLNFSYVNQATKPELIVRETLENGSSTSGMVTLTANNIEKSCPVVSPKDGGFVFAWRVDTEIRGGDYLYANANLPSDTDSYPLVNSVNFKGTVPPLVGVAGMDDNIAVLWALNSGPQVGLFNQKDQTHIGKDHSLPLTSGRSVGVTTVSSLSQTNAMWVTYRESAGSEGQRRLVKVTCPTD
jgi:hypothetical protein